MADEIRALSAQLAQDPQSLVFLRLGEALRRKGQLDSATRVAMNGLEVSEARVGRVLFTRPYYVFAERLMARKDDTSISADLLENNSHSAWGTPATSGT